MATSYTMVTSYTMITSYTFLTLSFIDPCSPSYLLSLFWGAKNDFSQDQGQVFEEETWSGVDWSYGGLSTPPNNVNIW